MSTTTTTISSSSTTSTTTVVVITRMDVVQELLSVLYKTQDLPIPVLPSTIGVQFRTIIGHISLDHIHTRKTKILDPSLDMMRRRLLLLRRRRTSVCGRVRSGSYCGSWWCCSYRRGCCSRRRCRRIKEGPHGGLLFLRRWLLLLLLVLLFLFRTVFCSVGLLVIRLFESG